MRATSVQLIGDSKFDKMKGSNALAMGFGANNFKKRFAANYSENYEGMYKILYKIEKEANEIVSVVTVKA